MVYERSRLGSGADGEGMGDLVSMLGDVAVAVLFGLLVGVLQTGGERADQAGWATLEDRKTRLAFQSVHHHANPYDRPFTPYNRWETLLYRLSGSSSK